MNHPMPGHIVWYWPTLGSVLSKIADGGPIAAMVTHVHGDLLDLILFPPMMTPQYERKVMFATTDYGKAWNCCTWRSRAAHEAENPNLAKLETQPAEAPKTQTIRWLDLSQDGDERPPIERTISLPALVPWSRAIGGAGY